MWLVAYLHPYVLPRELLFAEPPKAAHQMLLLAQRRANP